jgi:hypothetical protein
MSGGQQRKRIGEFMMERGLLHREWIDPILDHARSKNIRFGEAAVALGYVTEKELRQILVQPYHRQLFFHLNPEYFPRVTQDLIPVEDVVRYGVLPLGFKREFQWFRSVQRLNLGLLNPGRKDTLEWVRTHLGTVKAFKTFQILPEEFLKTLELCFGVDRSVLLEWGPDQIDGNLMLYLQLERRKRPRSAETTPKVKGY